MAKHATAAVFGVNNARNPLSYVVRDIEVHFREALSGPQSVIVLYGATKQGKTSLLRNTMPEKKRISTMLTSGIGRDSVYSDLLRKVGAPISVDGTVQVAPGPTIPILGSIFGLLVNVHKNWIPLDLNNANAVATEYNRYAKDIPIVLDNFHWADEALQKHIASDLLVFAQYGVKVLILGIWPSGNYLVELNSELSSRVSSFSIEPWSSDDLDKVVAVGEKLLNITFSSEVRKRLLSVVSFNNADAGRAFASGSVGLLQRILLEYLLEEGVKETCRSHREIGDTKKLLAVFQRIADAEYGAKRLQFGTIANSAGDVQAGSAPMMRVLIHAFLGHGGARTSDDGVRLDQIVDGAIRTGIVGRRDIDAQRAHRLLEHRLLASQKDFGSPILAYNEREQKIAMVDAVTRFVVRRRHEKLIQDIFVARQ